LNVPPSAGGRRARCPACGDRFIIPTRTDLLEDTVSGWIEQDVEDIFEDRIQTPKPDTTTTAPQTPVTPQEKKPEPAQQEKTTEKKQPPPAPAPQPEQIEADETIIGVPFDHAVTKPVKDSPPPKPVPATPRRPSSRKDDTGSAYPRNLQTDPNTPHLVVLKCGSAGVRFAFDAKWLNHEGFRASMPVRCVYSGIAERAKLMARPFVFADRSRGTKTNPADISANHDIRSLGDAGTRQIMNMMGTIEGMPSPFLYPMPYYISTRYANKIVHCITRDRPSGGITCEVVIPDAVCALEWLGRVNGVCGKDYEMLERDTSLLHGDRFQELSEVCRQRIQSWCKLRPHEVFELYINDADFGRLDEGLAGIVVTDQRVVYCKYHHRGQVRLDNEQAAIIAKPDGRFYALTLQLGNERGRMCKIHKSDLPKLETAIGKDSPLKLVVR